MGVFCPAEELVKESAIQSKEPMREEPSRQPPNPQLEEGATDSEKNQGRQDKTPLSKESSQTPVVLQVHYLNSHTSAPGSETSSKLSLITRGPVDVQEETQLHVPLNGNITSLNISQLDFSFGDGATIFGPSPRLPELL